MAEDSRGRNGTYTKHLLHFMRTPGLDIEKVFKRVRDAVMQETRDQQEPWESTSLRGDFVFVPGENVQVAVGQYPLQRNDPPRLVLSRAKIQDLQSRLQRLGLNPGPLDGTWGYRTEAAVRQFQSRQGLPVTGRVDSRTYEQLKVAVGIYPPRRDEPPAWPATLTDRLEIDFVRIPAGSFMMGSENGDDDEEPVHRVRISQPFYLGKYEVTQGQWVQMMGSNPSRFTGDANRPVEKVSLYEVQTFIKRLNALEGREIYRLPTEAEWEYAARAGTTTDFHFGNDKAQLGKYACTVITLQVRRTRWGGSIRIPGDCMTCMAMYGNGYRISIGRTSEAV